MQNTYTFQYHSAFDENSGEYPNQTVASKTISVDDCSAWPTILREFTNFLSGIYGYDISDQVLLTEKIGPAAGETYSVKEYE